ncbi:unnamed protein product [Rangifer tarandus platyrhynchus]|uniref:Uncharacterized protein n=2 Tax=Rangifer tarandus platyrhynchus TaxID=3082113 RepID=A0ABN8ZN20_RANTA|nr:unnamed protein product [Rangifer tarandus platyrhynchus]
MSLFPVQAPRPGPQTAETPARVGSSVENRGLSRSRMEPRRRSPVKHQERAKNALGEKTHRRRKERTFTELRPRDSRRLGRALQPEQTNSFPGVSFPLSLPAFL